MVTYDDYCKLQGTDFLTPAGQVFAVETVLKVENAGSRRDFSELLDETMRQLMSQSDYEGDRIEFDGAEYVFQQDAYELTVEQFGDVDVVLRNDDKSQAALDVACLLISTPDEKYDAERRLKRADLVKRMPYGFVKGGLDFFLLSYRTYRTLTLSYSMLETLRT